MAGGERLPWRPGMSVEVGRHPEQLRVPGTRCFVPVWRPGHLPPRGRVAQEASRSPGVQGARPSPARREPCGPALVSKEEAVRLTGTSRGGMNRACVSRCERVVLPKQGRPGQWVAEKAPCYFCYPPGQPCQALGPWVTLLSWTR